jgi:hypothetical protein
MAHKAPILVKGPLAECSPEALQALLKEVLQKRSVSKCCMIRDMNKKPVDNTLEVSGSYNTFTLLVNLKPGNFFANEQYYGAAHNSFNGHRKIQSKH